MPTSSFGKWIRRLSGSWRIMRSGLQHIFNHRRHSSSATGPAAKPHAADLQSKNNASSSAPELDDIDSRALSASGESATSSDIEIELLNRVLPAYEIAEAIDRGGQGIVYRAIQRSTGRVVALKVLHIGATSNRSSIRRFEREVAIVARLRHPHIVTIYDSGTMGDRPYLAMEFIDGLPIDDFVLLHRPSVDACVATFEKVCRAVASVHQRGVIHRDLKPSNILVDLDGEPHVLDFGLAKCFDDDSAAMSVSVEGQVVGTLPYLSPEQVTGTDGDVDTRSDIYSLGVILYALLSGSMPYAVSGTPDQIRESVVHRAPTRLERSRRNDSEACAVGAISGDLAQIVLKALSKEKERRYQSADALADDLSRYLKGDVVEAKADSNWYLLKKTLRRYRVHSAIAAAFVFLITGSLVGMIELWRRADQAARTAQAGLELGAHTRLSSLKRDEGRVEQAIELSKQSIEMALQVSNPDVVVNRYLVASHHKLAQAYLKKPETAEMGRKHCAEAAKISERLHNQDPDEPEYRRLLAFSCRLEGLVATESKEWELAERKFREAISLFQSIKAHRDEREDAGLEFEVALSKQMLAMGICRAGRPSEGLRLMDEVRLTMIRVHEIFPDSVDYLIELVATEGNIGSWLLRGKTHEQNVKADAILAIAEERLNRAIASGLAKNRMFHVSATLNAVQTNKAIATKRLSKHSATLSDHSGSLSLPGMSTGSPSPSPIGSESPSRRNE